MAQNHAATWEKGKKEPRYEVQNNEQTARSTAATKAHQAGESGTHEVHPHLAAPPRNRPGPWHRGLLLEKTGQSSLGPRVASKGLREMKQGLQVGSLPQVCKAIEEVKVVCI